MLKLTYYVDQTIRGKMVTTRFHNKTDAVIYAGAVGGTFRVPVEALKPFGAVLFAALEGGR